MMEIELFRARDAVLLPPALGRTVARSVPEANRRCNTVR